MSGPRIWIGAAVTQAGQLEGVRDVPEPIARSQHVRPLFDVVGPDLDCSGTRPAHEVMVVCITSWKPVASFAIVTMKGVDGAALRQPPKLAVDGSDPHPQPPRSQVRAEMSMKLGCAEKSIAFFQNFEKRLLTRGGALPLPPPAVTATMSFLPRTPVGVVGCGFGHRPYLAVALAVPRSARSAALAWSRMPCCRRPRACRQAAQARPTV